MALSPFDFMAPDGDLREVMYPGDDLGTQLLPAWIADAEAQTSEMATASQEAAQRAWVYHRAYRYRAVVLDNEPLRVDLDGEIATQRDGDQIRRIEARAHQYRAEYDALVADDEEEQSGTDTTTVYVL